ncbi:MAG: hypothetical protein Q9167_003951 [Letrouitia subvulpina]
MDESHFIRRVTQIGGGRLTQDFKDSTARKRKLALDSPTRNISVNPSKLSFPTDRDAPPRKTHRQLAAQESPPKYYHPFMEYEQAGQAQIARSSDHELVALKAIKPIQAEKVQFFMNKNTVSLIDVYRNDDRAYLVYELMFVSLRQIQATPRGLNIKSFEIAAICKEILNGLSFIHTELQLFHGHLDCGAILLNYKGNVKIANIGWSMIEEKAFDKEKEKVDVRGIGNVMMELMENQTWIADPGSITLQHPEKWKDCHGIKSFLRETATSTVAMLKKASIR